MRREKLSLARAVWQHFQQLTRRFICSSRGRIQPLGCPGAPARILQPQLHPGPGTRLPDLGIIDWLLRGEVIKSWVQISTGHNSSQSLTIPRSPRQGASAGRKIKSVGADGHGLAVVVQGGNEEKADPRHPPGSQTRSLPIPIHAESKASPQIHFFSFFFFGHSPIVLLLLGTGIQRVSGRR